MFRSEIALDSSYPIAAAPRWSPPLTEWTRLVWCVRYWALAGAVVGASGAIALPQVVTPSYRATAQIFIDPQNLQLLERDLSPTTAAGDAGVVLIESQSRVMASDSVLRATAQALGLDSDPEFIGGSNPIKALLEGPSDAPRDDLSRAVLALGKAVHVVRLDRTYVIDIHARSESATKAAAIANGVVSNYLLLRESQRAEQAGRASAALEGRLAQLLAELETSENAVERFKTDNGIVETGGQLLLENEVGQTNAALVAAAAAVDVARVQRDQLRALAVDPVRLAASPEAMGSSDIERLRGQLQTAMGELAVLRASFGARHPRLLEAEQRALDATTALDREATRLMAAADLALQRAEENAAALGDQLAGKTAALQATDAKRIRLRQLEREAEAHRAVYQDALLRSRETAEQAAIDTLNAQIVSEATPPAERSFPPKLSTLLPLGAFAGLLLGGAFGLWRQRRAQ